RILTVSCAALEAQTSTSLQAISLEGREDINSLFSYQLILQSPDRKSHPSSIGSNLDLSALLGQTITCHIQLEGMGAFQAGSVGGQATPHQGAGERQISAIITAAQLLEPDSYGNTPNSTPNSRHAYYQLTLEPWLALARHQSDCRIFQDQTPIEVIEHILAGYPYSADKRLIETYPVRDYCVQYNETDFEFITRLMQEWGINYHFEHSNGTHRLIYSDHNGAFQLRAKDLQQDEGAQDTHNTNPYSSIPYYPRGHKAQREYIHHFAPEHHLTSRSFGSQEYDYTRPKALLSAQASDDTSDTSAAQQASNIYLFRGSNKTLPASDYSQPNAGATEQANQTEEQGQHLAQIRLQTLRQVSHRATAAGHIRGIVTGSSFTLEQHPQESANTEYIVLGAQLHISNPSQTSTASQETSQDTTKDTSQDTTHGDWRILTQFTVQPSTLALRPQATQPKPTIAGPQSALVVGPSNAQGQNPTNNIYTDYLSRIKLHFPWDRHDGSDHHSSCWVRVASPWAGNQLGAVHIPRIGQEVLVSFEGGDPDKPVVIASLYNQNNQPPWELPEQQALSGIRSRELGDGAGNAAAGRSNHLLLDDTAEQIQVQLKSDHQSSSLSLGHITRIEDRAGRQEHRGEGFELRTDGHGAIRAQDGLLISTEGRPNAQGSVKASSETASRLSQGQEQHSSLGHLAVQHKAQDGAQSDGDSKDQGQVAKALQAQNEAIKGTQSKDSTNNSKHPELSEPHLVLASPAGIESTTTGSTHQHSNEHHAITA
ncbi:type VI secretion system tip protein VgrG, partial [Curvibacter sp. CHRR-16]|uniref:type VI secretion system Vgr family protein n=1 Tax=Curvibacter sp. CHRR-16 TaxID=2835872 RepID=UPI001BD9E97D